MMVLVVNGTLRCLSGPWVWDWIQSFRASLGGSEAMISSRGPEVRFRLEPALRQLFAACGGMFVWAFLILSIHYNVGFLLSCTLQGSKKRELFSNKSLVTDIRPAPTGPLQSTPLAWGQEAWDVLHLQNHIPSFPPPLKIKKRARV